MQSSFSGLKTAKGSQAFGAKQSWASASLRVTGWWHQPVSQAPLKGSYLGPCQSRGPTTAVMGTSACISSSLELPGEQGHSSFILLVLPGPLAQPLCEEAGEASLVALSATLISFLLRKYRARVSSGKHGLVHFAALLVTLHTFPPPYTRPPCLTGSPLVSRTRVHGLR